MSLRSRLVVLALPALLILGAAIPVYAATPTSAVVSGHCSRTSLTDLQVGREDNGQLSIDFGVDMARHRAGVRWKVSETDNGVLITRTTMYTIADGSFSLTRLITPRRGVNHIVATARNPLTGETCRLSTAG
jgi:hypothetical protein